MLKDSDLLGLKRAEYLHMISLYAWLCLNVCWFKDILITCITCCSVFQLHTINQVWLTDLALRLLCVLSLDRFGDYVSDEVSHSLYYWTIRTKLFHIVYIYNIYIFFLYFNWDSKIYMYNFKMLGWQNKGPTLQVPYSVINQSVRYHLSGIYFLSLD